MDWKIASIGTLSHNPHWKERVEQRTGHATSTIIKTKNSVFLVDPSLPPAVMDARLHERWGLRLQEVTHVFLTSFDLDRRRTLSGLKHATCLMHENEINCAKTTIEEVINREEDDPTLNSLLKEHLKLLERFVPSDDSLDNEIDLFPLPGFTDGSCGLLLPFPKGTVLITGDTIATQEHLDQGSVLQNCMDIETAKESFLECQEIADIIIPGRDNVILNPSRS